MIAYYALGGGLGHLTRARAVLHTLGKTSDAILLTSSPFALDRRVTGELAVEMVPPELAIDREAHRAWLTSWISQRRPAAFVSDTFPSGINGELRGIAWPDVTEVHHVARRMKWHAYENLADTAPLRFSGVWITEELEPLHLEYLLQHSDDVREVVLEDPPSASLVNPFIHPAWLVTHSDAGDETLQLIEYARETRTAERSSAKIYVVAPRSEAGTVPDYPDVTWLDVYPAAALFPYADRVFTGCGFNSMRQTAGIAHKHRFLPFQRRFDDQTARASSRRRWLQQSEAVSFTGSAGGCGS